MISLFIALTCVIIESLGEPSIQFMAATVVICVVALIFLGIEVINFIIWFSKTAEHQKNEPTAWLSARFSLCCYTCGKRVSVSLQPVYDIFSGFPVKYRPDCPCRYARSCLHVRAAAEARACDMRRSSTFSMSHSGQSAGSGSV